VGLRAELTVVPGPVDAESGRPSLQPPYEGALEDFLATPGVQGTEVEAALNRTLLEAAQDTAEAPGWWNAVRRFFTGEDHQVVAETEQQVELEGYWMILPDVPGASVTLTVSINSSSETSASFTIAGIGGGPTFTIALKEGLSHEAAVCERITVTTTGVFEKVQVTKDDRILGTYPRLRSLDMSNLSWNFTPVPPPTPALLGDASSTTHFNASATAGKTVQTLEITRGTTWNVSAGLDLPNLGGIKAQVSTKNTYERDVKLEYTLPGGHVYAASRYAGLPAYLWSLNSNSLPSSVSR
jgi:hypothetical protein